MVRVQRLFLFTMAALAVAGRAQANAVETFDCENAISGQPARCLDLSGRSFAGETLNSVNWSRARLVGTNLDGVSLRHALLIEADLSRASLRGANAYGASLYGANFDRTDLSGADLRGSNLQAADLRFAIIATTTLLNGAAFNSETQLPLEWGDTWSARRTAATRRGMLPVRE